MGRRTVASAPGRGALLACASLASAAVVQQGNLRITVLSQVQPYKLPREGTAPIAVFVAGHLQAPGGGIPAQLKKPDGQGQPPRPFAVEGPAGLPDHPAPTGLDANAPSPAAATR